LPERVRGLEASGASVIPLETGQVREGLMALAALDLQSVILEGGPALQRAALDEGLVDELHLYIAPRVLGQQGIPWLTLRPEACRSRVVARQLGRDVFLEGHVHRTR